MAKNTSITLGDHFDGFITERVASGRYGSASEAVRAGLRLLEEREMRIDALRRAIQDGEGSGEPRPFDMTSFLAEMREEHDEDV